MFCGQGSDTRNLACFGCSLNAVLFHCMTADRKQQIWVSGVCCQLSVHTCYYGLAGTWQLLCVPASYSDQNHCENKN